MRGGRGGQDWKMCFLTVQAYIQTELIEVKASLLHYTAPSHRANESEAPTSDCGFRNQTRTGVYRNCLFSSLFDT